MEIIDESSDARSQRATKRKPTKRASLACVQCRSSHLKCDATTPVCLRCADEDRTCVYLKSRRGGRIRAGAAACQQQSTGHPALRDTQTAMLSPSPTRVLPNTWDCFFTTDFDSQSVFNGLDTGALRTSEDCVAETPEPSASSCQYLQLYYQFFHNAHPCVLPRQYLEQRAIESRDLIRPLLLVMKYVGSLYSSTPLGALRRKAREAVTQRDSRPNGFLVQACLLFSVGLYWSDEVDDALYFLKEAIQMACSLGMHLRTFSEQNGGGDLVLEESWRRTWWLLFLIDINVAASSHTSRLVPSNLSITADLPCEEDEYESGVLRIDCFESWSNRLTK